MLLESTDDFGIPFELAEGVEPDDAILQFPVTVLGKSEKSDGIPYHLTIRWGKGFDADKLVDDVSRALSGLDLTPPRLTHLKTDIFRGPKGDKEFFVLVSDRVPQNVLKIKDAVDAVFGPDQFPEFKLHITVDKELWDRVQKEKLSAGDLKIDVDNLELKMGNKLLKSFKHTVECYLNDFGIPIYE